MPDQPTPKPLTAEEEAQFRAYVDLTGHRAVSRALDHIDASRAETAALRESLAAAEKQRDERRERKVLCEQLQADRDRLAAELAEARKILDRLPKTADGVVLVPELDGVFHAGFDSEGDIERSGETEWVGMFYATDTDGTGTVWTYPVSDCYSTREAALAARDSGKASGGVGE